MGSKRTSTRSALGARSFVLARLLRLQCGTVSMTPHEIDGALTLARTRRHFFRDCGVGVGAMALGSMLARDTGAKERNDPLAPRKPHFPAKAKAVIYLFMAGAPSQ